MVGSISGLRAQIIKGFQGTNATATPSTFWIKYLNTTTNYTEFTINETFSIELFKYKRGTQAPLAVTNPVFAIDANTKTASGSDRVGKAFGIQMSPGIVFQKGHFSILLK